MEKAKVYFTKEITPNSLIKIYEALGQELKGKVAVKISTGEMGGHNFLNPQLIKPLVDKLNGTIVECNTAYAGKRNTTADHWETIKAHGFLDIAPVDIMDEDGSIQIPVKNGKHLHGYNIVGSHITRYDSMLMLSHFKGHMMAGFGGALKNMSIGVASSAGKAWIHTAGITDKPSELWEHIDDQDGFLESMTEADEAVINHFGAENMAYINVANKLSIDCDCDANPHEPEIADIGIFASLDPVAVDKACLDAVYNLDDPKKASLINRIEERHGVHTVEAAENLGLGTTNYEIIEI